ncbi:hypothetical protein A3Q56_06384, partial [Intoshia linei]
NEILWKHLLLVIHGMGVNFNGYTDFVDSVDTLKKNINGKNLEENAIECVPIIWFDINKSFKSPIRAINETNAANKVFPFMTRIIHDMLSDILLFKTEASKMLIFTTVLNRMNTTVENFKTINPYFKGTINICAHSLGAVIMTEILLHSATPRIIKFKPNAFFSMGGPIMLFLEFEEILFWKRNFKFPLIDKFINIYYVGDFLAYKFKKHIADNETELTRTIGKKKQTIKLPNKDIYGSLNNGYPVDRKIKIRGIKKLAYLFRLFHYGVAHFKYWNSKNCGKTILNTIVINHTEEKCTFDDSSTHTVF